MKDYYTILGVSRNATSGQIKAAYRRLAIQFHPDKNPDPQAEEIFKEINEAYDVLGDPNEKAQYDWKLNPFNTIVSEMEAEAAKPKHRDPAYHKRPRPPVKPRSDAKQNRRELMAQYLPFFKWACSVGVVWGFIFWLDFFLPYSFRTEKIVETYTVPGTRSSRHQFFRTDTNKEIKVYSIDTYDLYVGDELSYSQTLILKTVMDFEYQNSRIKVGNIYGGIALFPTVLLIVALAGFRYKYDIEFYFSASVVCTVLFVMNLLLIL